MSAAQQVRWVPVEEIVEDEAVSLAESDVVLLCQRAEGGYTLLGGQQRLQALRRDGQLCVQAVLSPGLNADQMLSDLLDRLVRGNIHYLDEARAYRDLMENHGLSAQQLSQRLGRTIATLRRKLRLLTLGSDVEQALRQNGLCERYAQELLRLPGQQGRQRVLKQVTDGGLSVKETEKLIDEVLSRMPVPMTSGRRLKPLMRDHRLYLNAIRDIVEQMNDAGLEAVMQVTVGRHVAEVRISVPVLNRSK